MEFIVGGRDISLGLLSELYTCFTAVSFSVLIQLRTIQTQRWMSAFHVIPKGKLIQPVELIKPLPLPIREYSILVMKFLTNGRILFVSIMP